MDSMARLKELSAKLESVGLTRAEQMEIELIYTKALIEARDSLKK